jgi:hypothetical protein
MQTYSHPKICHKDQSSCTSPCDCNGIVGQCRDYCVYVSTTETGAPDNYATTMGHITHEFIKHRDWIVRGFFGDAQSGDRMGLKAAMELMANQLSANAMQQVNMIGQFFDAKHQLETQRLFQKLTARAHKDYHPSQGLCTVGTMSRSLSGSSRNSEIASTTISKQILDRQILASDKIAEGGTNSDARRRLANFINNFCGKNDNSGQLDLLCKKGTPNSVDTNKDINFTNAMGVPLTLDIDFLNGSNASIDENAVLALSQNLFSHRLFPFKPASAYVKKDGTPSLTNAGYAFLNMRALIAKRNVAADSFAAIAGQKAKGSEESTPFIYALMKEMGGTEITEEEIRNEIGGHPSYYAQMEVLTKKLYQRPEFYSNLYDKPANVKRKNVAIQAANLMQKRDLYQSYLRSEMALAVMLETLLIKEQNKDDNRQEGQ